jgi:hypothetical protein
VGESRRSGRYETGIDRRRGEPDRRLDRANRLERVAKDTVLGIRSRRLGSGVPVGVLVVDNQRRVAQKIIAFIVQQ